MKRRLPNLNRMRKRAIQSTLQFGIEVAELVRDFRRGDGIQIGLTETFDGQCLTVPYFHLRRQG
jgi:hypothetical protein